MDASQITKAGVATSASQVRKLSPENASKLVFVAAAGVSFLLSVYLWFLVDREQGMFVGLWVPSILALGALLMSGKKASR